MASRKDPVEELQTEGPLEAPGALGGPPPTISIVCHCRQVSYARVEKAIDRSGARSLADLQRQTAACTRCFGCRFELERMLEERLGPAFVRTSMVTLPAEEVAPRSRWVRLRGRIGLGGARETAPVTLPRRMYIPVLEGFRGQDVRTRAILFNSFDEHDEQVGRRPDVSLRADLLAPDGTRLAAREVRIEPRHSAVLDVREMIEPGALAEGVGVLKLVVEAEQLGSFRPYFHLISPRGISSTHEKAAPRPSVTIQRGARPRLYYWLMPIGFTRRPEHAYLFLTATQTSPLDRHKVVWQPESGDDAWAPLPPLELDQSACVALHELFPPIARGDEAGTVRIEPNYGVPAAFMIRFDPERELWRIQHL